MLRCTVTQTVTQERITLEMTHPPKGPWFGILVGKKHERRGLKWFGIVQCRTPEPWFGKAMSWG